MCFGLMFFDIVVLKSVHNNVIIMKKRSEK